MKLVYQPKKWAKNAAHRQKTEREWKGLHFAEWTMDCYLHPEHRPPMMPLIADRVTLYVLLHGDYRAQLEMQYICGQVRESLDSAYLFAAAAVRAHQLAKTEEITNPAAEQAVRIGSMVPETVFALIAANEWDWAQDFANAHDPLLAALLSGDDAAARKSLKRLLDSMDEAKHQWGAYLQDFQEKIFAKQIWLAMLNGDAARMQAAMEARIHEARRLPWDYSAVIDLDAVAQVKLAARRGLHIDIPVIEIPAYYLDFSHRIDRNVTRLPEVPEKI